ncbi:MAG: ATP-binding protein [Actinomycetaceae bacterium]|nr:ATP-binding protein [Actinomycetaceae bacterium]
MLLDFTVKNFRCFAEEAHLSLVKPSLKTQVPRGDLTWRDATYRVAAVYGANASGKSTLLEAVWALAAAMRLLPGVKLHDPYLLSEESASAPTSYAAIFTHEGVRYDYEVQAHSWGIGYESLHSYARGSRRRLFIRRQLAEDQELAFSKGPSLTGPSAGVRKLTTAEDLFLAIACRYGHKMLAPIARAVSAGTTVSATGHGDFNRSVGVLQLPGQLDRNPRKREEINMAARMADLGITDVAVRERDLALGQLEHLRSLKLPESELKQMRDELVFTHRGVGGKTRQLGLNQQSDGTINWLVTLGPALEAIRHGHVLVVDELDASLHPALASTLVQIFKDPDINVSGAQLLFSTHDTSLLGNSPIRLLEPGEVWFCQKDDEGASELYPLSDFDTRPGNNEQKRYLAGKFGAIPRVDLSEVFALTPSGSGNG